MKTLSSLDDSSDSHWPVASLRSWLVALIVLATLPIAGWTGYLIYSDAEAQQQRLQLALQQSADTLAQIVERELVASIDALNGLAGTASVQRHNLAAFGQALRSSRSLRPDWFSAYLRDSDGSLLFDTSTPAPGRPGKDAAPPVFAPPTIAGQPARISNLVAGAAPGQHAIAVDVPATIAGQPGYRLGAWIAAPVWQNLVQQAALPAGAVASLRDREQRLIARSEARAPSAGSKLPQMQELPVGAANSTANATGGATFVAGKNVAPAGWRVEVGVPLAALGAARQAAIGAALAAIAWLLSGIALAVLLARRLTRPLHQLASDPLAPASTPNALREVAQLRDALHAARAQAENAHAQVENRLNSTEQNLQESQRLMDLAEEAGHVGFFHYRFATDALLWTPGLCRLFGLEPLARESSLAYFLSCIGSEHRQRIENSLRDTCAAHQEKETLEFRVALAGGAGRWLASRILINYGDDGGPLQMIGVTLDINDQKEAERDRATLIRHEHAARVEAEAANRAKDEFLAMLGHELRNPLSAIAAAIEVLDHVDAGADTALNARRIIARQTRHLARLMDDLLDVARVISGKILLARQRINLAPLVERLVATLQLTGAAERHALNAELDDVWIDADATRIEQVVNNLLTNALKYTPAGGRIDVRVARDGEQALFEVRDTGVGIAPALLPKIFDLFVQAERTLDRRAGGLGIGLTLVRRLVELHDGSVSAASSTAGSVFTVRLPAVEAPAGAPERQHIPPSRRRRVGVIEDNEDALDSLHKMLELDGHAVWCATDGVSGLAALLERRPDVAVVDIGLPGLTGLEVAKRSRAAGYAGRMIALSGYGQDSNNEQALAAGFDAYLVKPVDAEQLRRILAED